MPGQDLDGCLVRHTVLFTLSAAGTTPGVYGRFEIGAGTCPFLLHGNGFILDRAGDIAGPAMRHAGYAVTGVRTRQHGYAHVRVPDVREFLAQGIRRTGRNAGDVLAHLTGYVPGNEIRRSRRHFGAEFGELQGVVGAIPDAQAAAYTGAGEILFRNRSGGTNGPGRRGNRLLRV